MTQATRKQTPSWVSGALAVTPAFPGKVRLVETLGKIGSRMGDGQVSFLIRSGARLRVDLHDRIQQHMWGGCYEPHVRRCLEGLLRPGNVFLDIGAHIGYHSVSAASLVGPAGSVFSFEPDPVLYASLSCNLEQFPWAQCLHCAVWRSSGAVPYERSSSKAESGWGTLCAVRRLGSGECLEVDAVSLDDWQESTRIHAIDVIKLDAEGSEVAILQGARKTLERFRPFLISELNGILLQQAGTSSAELASELERHRYIAFALFREQFVRWYSEKPDDFRDLLWVPGEKSDDAQRALALAGFRP